MYGYNPYQKNQIQEASQEDILLQLIEGGIVRLKQARDLWNRGEKGRARERRQRAYEIIAYLDGTLDRENGGEIADELEALYAYMLREITTSVRTDDFGCLSDVEDVLATLYEGWKDAVIEYKKEQKAKQMGGYSGQEEHAHVASVG